MNSRYVRYRIYKGYRRIVRSVASRLYMDRIQAVDRSLLVAGTARSGTTWLADLIASQVSCRIMFEPFHPYKVSEYANFNYFQYMRPEEENPALTLYTEKVLTGAIRDPWIDKQVEHLFPEFRLIKTIRANLLLKWMKDNYSELALILLLRHPCAVVASRMKLGWWTDKDIEPFRSQSDLVDDYLADKMEFIEDVQLDEQKHAIIWCIHTLVPMRQFKTGEIPIIFYENLVRQPEDEVPRAFRALNIPFQANVYQAAARPSTTSLSSSAILTGKDPVRQWKKELTSQQVENILDVVNEFGLDHLYGESEMPLVQPTDGNNP
jgi:hypothetical protein